MFDITVITLQFWVLKNQPLSSSSIHLNMMLIQQVKLPARKGLDSSPPLLNTEDWPRRMPHLFARSSGIMINIPERSSKDHRKIIGDGISSTDVVKLVQLKFLVQSECLESVIDLIFIANITSYKSLADSQLRPYVESKSMALKDAVTIYRLDKLVEDHLNNDMSDNNGLWRIENLMFSYEALLRCHGFSLVTTGNEKIAVKDFLSAIRPEYFRSRLELDLD